MGRYIPPTWQEFDSNGDPLNGGKLYFYTTETLTPKNTYSDDALTTPNTNPVVADSAGRFGDIFLESGTYRVILKDSDDVEIWDRDPVDGAIGTSGTVDEITSNYTITLSDATKLLAVDASSGAVVITLLPAATATDGFEITIKKTDTSTNSVTIDGDGSETIDGDASKVLTTQNQSIRIRSDGANWQVVALAFDTLSLIKGDDVASANALTLGSGNYFDITGTTAITSIGTRGVGTTVKLHFDGALTLTHHATDLILPGAANITTAAGDEAEFVEYASGDWRCTNYQRASGLPIAADPFSAQLLHVRDQKTANTAGGDFTAGSYVTRTLNTSLTNEISGASLGSNQITLPAGTYYIEASAPGFDCGGHKTRLYNTDDTSTILVGTSETCVQGNETQTQSFVRGRFTLAAQKVLELQHQCGQTKATTGLGNPVNLGSEVEVYADVRIWKVA